MREQLIATVERDPAPVRRLDRARVRFLAPRQVVREARYPRAVTAVDRLKAVLETNCCGRLESSLLELAVEAACDVETARIAVSSLDPVDHVFSVDIQRVSAEESWELTWAPVTSIVDLMLDWDLMTLDITVAELSEWLSVSLAVTDRAVDWLTFTPGVSVLRSPDDHEATVQIAIAVDYCPLTAEARPAAG